MKLQEKCACWRHVAAKIIRRVGWSFAIACFVMGYLLWARCHQQEIDPANKPHAVGSAAWVVETYGCEQVKHGEIPSKAIVDLHDGKGWRLSTDVQSAFEQMVHDGHIRGNSWTPAVDHHIRVNDFCK